VLKGVELSGLNARKFVVSALFIINGRAREYCIAGSGNAVLRSWERNKTAYFCVESERE
jgi:hypothetical protein